MKTDRTYDCNQCNKQFANQGNLTKHIKSVHEGVKYACNQCDKQYTDQSSLTKHIQSVHEGSSMLVISVTIKLLSRVV